MAEWIGIGGPIAVPGYGHRRFAVNNLEEFPAAARVTPTRASAVVNDEILARRDGNRLIPI